MNKIYLTIKDNEMKAIPLSSILTIEAEDHYVSIYYKYEGKIKSLFAYAKISDFARILPGEFVRVGRSQIINTGQVLCADGDTVKFANAHSLRLKTRTAVRFFFNELSLAVKKR